MSPLLFITIICSTLILLLIARFPKRQHAPCALGFADAPMEVLVIRKRRDIAWVLYWKSFQGWEYEFDRDVSDDGRCRDRVSLEFTNIIVEIHGTNLKRVRQGVVASTLSLLQEVTDEEARVLNKRGEPVIKTIEVMPARVMEIKAAGHEI
jgi:hypothetical protein